MIRLEQIAIKNLSRWLVHGLIAVLGLGTITIASYPLHLNLAATSLLFVIVIVLLARAGDLIPSVIVSIIASGLLAYIAPPANSFRIDDPLDIVAVAAFLFTSLIIAGLVSKLRRMTQEALSSVHRSLIDAEDRERARIARDLQEDVLQRMALLRVQIDQLAGSTLTTPGQFVTNAEALSKQVNDLSKDVHCLAYSLYSPKLEYLGLVKTMKAFCRDSTDHGKIEIKFKGDDLTNAPQHDVSLTLFRILQEALHNSTKHSGAPMVDVELFEATDGLHLMIRDAGVGFDPKAAVTRKGLGLISMQERIKLVRGDLSIQSQVNHGTIVHARVPILRTKTAYSAA